MNSAIYQPKFFSGSGFLSIPKMNLSDVLQFLVVCMIISATKPQTAEWMDDFMIIPVIILQNIFKIKAISLKAILKDLRQGVREHMISGKTFGITAFLSGQNQSFTLSDNFFVFFKELVNRVFKNKKQTPFEVEPQVVPQVEPQVVPNQCWCDGSSKQCSVCAKKSCYCTRCVGSPCDKFLPAIVFMRNISYNYLRKISCISIFLSLRFPGRLRSSSDLKTAIVLNKLTHADEFELDQKTRRKLLHMSLGIKLTNFLFARFTNSTYGGQKFIKRWENRLNSLFFWKIFRKGRYEEKRIPWHNGIRGMNLYSFNYVFFKQRYYSFLLSVALNPNPFRWIFNNSKRFSQISMSIEGEVQSISWYSFWQQRYDIYCQSEIVRQMIISYRNAILYGNYEENGSFPDFLKVLCRDLDLNDPSQDDFNKCVRKR